MIQSTVFLIREKGVEGTAFSDVIEHSKAPRGSIYHHFPGGKAQLVTEATEFAGDAIAAGIVKAMEAEDPVAGLRQFSEGWKHVLSTSDFTAGCPALAAALDMRTESSREAAAGAFKKWTGVLATAFRDHGVNAARADSLATMTIAAIEGAIVLARADQSIEPLERVTQELERLVTAALPVGA